ncbi:MAG: hypothetical protein AAB870_04005 [Patescibacteria group bacterium]
MEIEVVSVKKSIPSSSEFLFMEIPEGTKYICPAAGGIEQTADFTHLEECKGQYASNNSTLAFIDSEGKGYVGPYDKGLVEELQVLGYQSGNFWVPFSNGEYPSEQPMKDEYTKMKEGAREKRIDRRIKEIDAHYLTTGYTKGLKPVQELINFFECVDGIAYQKTGTTTLILIKEPNDGNDINRSRLHFQGTFDIEGAYIVFIDILCRAWVGPYIKDIVDILIACGYRYKIYPFRVPFAKGEMKLDKKIYHMAMHSDKGEL